MGMSAGRRSPWRELSQLSVGRSYRFVRGPRSRVEGELEILDAINVGGPFPPCTKEPGSLTLEGLPMDQVQTRFGDPEREATFSSRDRMGRLDRVLESALDRVYPTDTSGVRIEEWSWRWEDCVLSVWFHAPTAQWHVLDDVYRPLASTGATPSRPR